jgi:hypothetical protein
MDLFSFVDVVIFKNLAIAEVFVHLFFAAFRAQAILLTTRTS